MTGGCLSHPSSSAACRALQSTVVNCKLQGDSVQVVAKKKKKKKKSRVDLNSHFIYFNCFVECVSVNGLTFTKLELYLLFIHDLQQENFNIIIFLFWKL